MTRGVRFSVARPVFVFTALMILLILNGCGSGKQALNLQTRQSAQAFTLNVSEDSLIDSAQAEAFELDVKHTGTTVDASVRVTGAQGLKALYLDVEFDAERYTPIGFEPTALLGADDELLRLEVLSEQGRAHFGQVLIHPQEQEGFSGDGVIVVLHFKSEPQSATRTVSAPPTGTASQALLTKQGSQLDWLVYNSGDYNQDGMVTVSDLTPLGVHFMEQSSGFPAPFPINLAESVIDGDGNGEINVSDITPIGASYNCSILGGFNIYESLDINDYPADPADFGDPPTITPLATIPFSACTGDKSVDRLCSMANVYTSLVDAYYWVRPTDGTDDGTPSNLAGGDTTTAVQFSVASPPSTGTGKQSDPYVIGTSSVIDFELYDPGTSSQIPATDADAELIVDNPAAGTLSGFQFTSDASFTGQFSVFALYQDMPANPQKICFYVSQAAGTNNPPVAQAHVAPTAGAAPLYTVFYGGSSYDFDTGDAIASYEWDFGEGAGYQTLTDTEIHSYTTAGTYDTLLRVTDTNGATDTAAVRITVSAVNPNGPTAALSANPTSGDMPLAVTFDASLSTAGANPITTYEYDLLGNGAFVTGASTYAYTFNQAGVYRVTMRVTDSASYTDAAWVDIVVTDPGGTPAPPVAILAVAPDKGQAPLAVTFDLTGSSTGATMTYKLDPGDGSAAYDPAGYPTQAHTYSAAGTYIATLVTTDTSDGSHSLPAFKDVVVVNPTGALTAVLSAAPLSGVAPLAVNFDATSSSGGTSPYTYEFDYDNDGSWDVTGDTTGLASYTYPANGVYTARVRVTDTAWAVDEDTVTITVSSGGGALTANLVANPAAGGAPLAVSLDATGSSGGTPPYTYDFDYTDDGTYDVTGDTSGTAPNTYNTAGDYTARVKVTDSSTPTPLTGEDTALIEVTVPLAPQLTANPPNGLDPLTTTLDATGTTGGKAPLTYDFDYTDDGTWDVTGNTTGSVSGVVYTPGGNYTARVRVNDSCVTPQSAETTTSVDSVALLIANLTATPTTGIAPPADSVLLDASGTLGGLAPFQYRFDFESDGTWDTTWGASASISPTAPYYAPGIHTATVEVQDSLSGTPQTSQATAMFVISRNTAPTPPSGWHVVTVAGGIIGNFMSYTGLTRVQGVPVISFYNDDAVTPGAQGLYCVVANDVQGNTWGPPVLVQPGATGVHSSIKEVVGEPAIAFFDQTQANLEYIRRVGGIWPAGSQILDAVNCGSWCSMDFIYDDSAQLWLPAVSYIGEIGLPEFEWQWHGGEVRYIPSVFPPDDLGTSWHAPQIVDTSAPLWYPQFACTSLEYVDYVNNFPSSPPPYTWSPAVSYIALDWDPNPNGLKYSIAVDRLGWTWSRAGFPMWVLITPQATVGTATSLEKYPNCPWNPLALGAAPPTPGNAWMPWISWCTTVTPFGLNLEEATNEPGSAWILPGHQPDQTVPTIGDWSSTEMVGGVLGTSHVNYGSGELHYVDMATTNPLTWNVPEFPDPQPMPGADWKWGTYLIENQGYPAIAYYYWDGSGFDQVRYAVFY